MKPISPKPSGLIPSVAPSSNVESSTLPSSDKVSRASFYKDLLVHSANIPALRPAFPPRPFQISKPHITTVITSLVNANKITPPPINSKLLQRIPSFSPSSIATESRYHQPVARFPAGTQNLTTSHSQKISMLPKADRTSWITAAPISESNVASPASPAAPYYSPVLDELNSGSNVVSHSSHFETMKESLSNPPFPATKADHNIPPSKILHIQDLLRNKTSDSDHVSTLNSKSTSNRLGIRSTTKAPSMKPTIKIISLQSAPILLENNTESKSLDSGDIDSSPLSLIFPSDAPIQSPTLFSQTSPSAISPISLGHPPTLPSFEDNISKQDASSKFSFRSASTTEDSNSPQVQTEDKLSVIADVSNSSKMLDLREFSSQTQTLVLEGNIDLGAEETTLFEIVERELRSYLIEIFEKLLEDFELAITFHFGDEVDSANTLLKVLADVVVTVILLKGEQSRFDFETTEDFESVISAFFEAKSLQKLQKSFRSSGISIKSVKCLRTMENESNLSNPENRSLLLGALIVTILLAGIVTTVVCRRGHDNLDKEDKKRDSQTTIYLESEPFVTKSEPNQLVIMSYEDSNMSLFDAPKTDKLSSSNPDVSFKMIDGPDMLVSTSKMDQWLTLWDDGQSIAGSTVCSRSSLLDDQLRPEYNSEKRGHKFRPWDTHGNPREPALRSRLLRPFKPSRNDYQDASDKSVSSDISMKPLVSRSRISGDTISKPESPPKPEYPPCVH
jgi:hypothetical protein